MQQLPAPLSRLAAALLFAALAAPLTWAAPDYQDDYHEEPPSRVGRVSKLDGEAALLQSGSQQWQSLDQNGPVFEGDEVYVGNGSRAELQFGGGRYVRLDERSDVVVARLDEDSVRLEIAIGTVIVSLMRDERFEISAPAAAVTLEDEGVYRVDVDGEGDTRVSVHRGSAEASGVERAVEVDEGESAYFPYDDPHDVRLDQYAYFDDFDSWSNGIDDEYARLYTNTDSEVSSLLYRNDIYGLAELARYGSWISVGSYGRCWQPANVGYGWQPYSNGYWRWSNYGYTWVSNDPWGWAPFHYGRWAYEPSYGWVWVPWSRFSYGYNWSPGYVYWGNAPGYNGYVCVPLAPNEPYVATRRFDRRRDRNWVPEHLRAGRGIGVTKPGSGARLVPQRSARIDFDGRAVTAIQPVKPSNLTPEAPRVKPSIGRDVRERPVVVKNPRAGSTTHRTPVVKEKPRRAERPATTARPDKPRRVETPERVETPRHVDKPRRVEESPRRVEKPSVTVEPRRRAEPRETKPQRVERSQPKVERQPRIKREKPN